MYSISWSWKHIWSYTCYWYINNLQWFKGNFNQRRHQFPISYSNFHFVSVANHLNTGEGTLENDNVRAIGIEEPSNILFGVSQSIDEQTGTDFYLISIGYWFQWSRSGRCNYTTSLPISFTSAAYACSFAPIEGDVTLDNPAFSSISLTTIRFSQYGNNRYCHYIVTGV